jgi:hypothetical protein
VVTWEKLLVVVAAVCLLCGAFVVTHVHPLTEDEVRELATKRRNRQITTYFTFRQGHIAVDAELKKRMVPTGTSYPLSYPLYGFPSLAAALLKYKKHEWMLVAFERNKQVELVWENKGPDNTQVSLLADSEFLFSGLQRDYDSVLVFHNHPNADPRHFDALVAGGQDNLFAAHYADLFNGSGLNFLMFVCERGRYREFFRSPADTFLPLPDFVAAINGANGLGKLRNLRLHLERVFGKLGIAPSLTLHPDARQHGQLVAPLAWNPYSPASPSIWSDVRRVATWVLKGSLICGGIVVAWYGLKFLFCSLGLLFLLTVIAKGKKGRR